MTNTIDDLCGGESCEEVARRAIEEQDRTLEMLKEATRLSERPPEHAPASHR